MLPTTNSIQVRIPDGSTMHSSHTTQLHIPPLPIGATQAHILPSLAHNLISIGQLCDHDCVATFDRQQVTIRHNNTTILQGHRDKHTGLWCLPTLATTSLATAPCPQTLKPALAHNAYTVGLKSDLIKYLHRCCFSPTTQTWLDAIRQGYFATWPGLTAELVTRHLPKTDATIKGHLRQQYKNTRPTHVAASAYFDDIMQPSVTTPTNAVFASIFEPTGQIYTDQTGRFPAASSKGTKYVMILYDYDSNARQEAELVRAYSKLHTYLTSRGLKPRLQRLDNEAPAALKSYMLQQDVDYQLVPPHVHRRNAAERAISTFKDHFIAGLASTDKLFPMHQWCRLIPQCVLTLNLLRQSRLNHRLSAEEQLNGTYDFNRTPLAPPGTRVIVHEKPAVRQSWAPHGVNGWYLGPATEHYRCYEVYISKTGHTRISDTVEFMPADQPMLRTASTDAAIQAALQLTSALQNPSPAAPFATFGHTTLEALRQLADIFSRSLPIEPTATPSAPSHNTPATVVPAPRVNSNPTTIAAAPRVNINPTTTAAVPRVSNTPTHAAPSTNAPAHSHDSNNTPAGPHIIPTDGEEPPRPFSAAEEPIRLTLGPGPTRRQPTSTPTVIPQTAPEQPPPSTTHAVPNMDAPPLLLSAPGTLPGITPVSHNTRHRDKRRPSYQYAHAVIDTVTGKSCEYRHLITGTVDGHSKEEWQHSFANELGRLANGVGARMPTGTGTIKFIPVTQVPDGRKPTYGRIVVSVRPQKTEKYRTRLTVGGNLIEYPFEVSTPTADLTTAKLLFNSVVSTPNAKFMVTDIKDFYLNTEMARHEFMKLPLNLIPEEIVQQYNLASIVHKDYVYIEICKGMYGLPQAGKLANEQLTTHLAKYGYKPTKHTPGLWCHEQRPITFSLVVDDFGVKYTDKRDADHLVNALQDKYKITTDWEGLLYCGLKLDWDYKTRTVDLSMPGYVAAALKKFQHPPPAKPQYAPHEWIQPIYGQKVQAPTPTDDSPLLDPKEINRIQQVVGTLLYYARAVDSTMLVALGTLAEEQTKGTEQTATAVVQLLDYAATNPDAKFRYTASDMVLHIDSDASHLSLPQARSRAGGYYYMSAKSHQSIIAPTQAIPLNGAVFVLSHKLRNVMASAAEAEVGALFENGQEAVSLRNTLTDLGHQQPPTPIKTDNSTAAGITNNTMKQRKSKAMDMRFYWLRDRTQQGQFLIYWRPGTENLADYFTKHHSASHHKDIRSTYLHQSNNDQQHAPQHAFSALQGCINIARRASPILTTQTANAPRTYACQKHQCTKRKLHDSHSIHSLIY